MVLPVIAGVNERCYLLIAGVPGRTESRRWSGGVQAATDAAV